MRSPSARPRVLRAVALSLLLVVSAAAFGAAAVGSAAAADARVTLTDTAVTPATPTVGAPITAETTLRLSGGSDTSMTVEEVRVVDPNEDDAVLGTATDLGRLSPARRSTSRSRLPSTSRARKTSGWSRSEPTATGTESRRPGPSPSASSPGPHRSKSRPTASSPARNRPCRRPSRTRPRRRSGASR
ncbi:hypothetical protein ACFQER_03745 [Halomicroarcula sp. GCM10025894]|uniref:hypothetical protein n=1 Tax=Halomicroarcula sp. GCM10025894 TaxID=3252673 RepID=UPI00360C8708